MKTIAYIRVSTDKQTVENQRYEIDGYCHNNGLKVDEEMLFEISSRKSESARGIDVLKDSLEHGDILICSELSRLGRDTSSVIALINELVANGVRIVMIKQNLDIRSNDITSKVMITMFSLFSELERDFISMRTKEALAMRKKAGVKLGRRVGSRGVSKYAPFKSRIVKLLKQGVSVRQIALQHLNELNLKNPTGLHSYVKSEGIVI